MAETVDPITLDIIENALKNARFEMDGIVCRISLSPVIREQHDEFPFRASSRNSRATSMTVMSSFGMTLTPARARSRTTMTGA
jgi:N-methylhydantoinase B/oxoprolinase/acetone carboxylase alpha subunit